MKYRWIVFLHVLSAFTFVLLHGTSALAAFVLKREKHLRCIRALLELSNNYFSAMYGALLVMLVAGIIAGFMGR